jgi:hypothetical protein
MTTPAFSSQDTDSSAGVAAFEFLPRKPPPRPHDGQAHYADRAAYWAQVVSGLPAEHAVAVLTATTISRAGSSIGRRTPPSPGTRRSSRASMPNRPGCRSWPWRRTSPKSRRGSVPAKSPPRATGGGFLLAPHAASGQRGGRPQRRRRCHATRSACQDTSGAN